MNSYIKKSVLLIVFLQVCTASCSEEHKSSPADNQSVGALTIEIPEDRAAHSIIAGKPIEQTADQLAEIIACFKNAKVQKQTTEFFQGQTSDALEAFNCAAKISLQETLDKDIDTKATTAFTKRVVDSVQQGLQQQHENRCAALQQQRKLELKKFKRDTCKNQCAFMGIGSLATICACGMVILTSLGRRCS